MVSLRRRTYVTDVDSPSEGLPSFLYGLSSVGVRVSGAPLPPLSFRLHPNRKTGVVHGWFVEWGSFHGVPRPRLPFPKVYRVSRGISVFLHCKPVSQPADQLFPHSS